MATAKFKIYEFRFRNYPSQFGFDTLISFMDGKFPSYGYSILAQILTETRNNVVLTTNFDNLSEQAVYYYTSTWPLIIGHENLADYAQLSNSRPLIVKLHRDLTRPEKSCLVNNDNPVIG